MYYSRGDSTNSSFYHPIGSSGYANHPVYHPPQFIRESSVYGDYGAHHPHYVAAPNAFGMLAAVPVPTVSSPQCYCSFCNQTNVVNHPTSTIQVPVLVNVATGLPNSSAPLNKKDPLENELMAVSPPSYQHLAPFRPRSLSMKRKSEDGHQKPVNVPGLTKWFLKRRTDQMAATSISKNKIQRAQKALKRLNNKIYQRHWKTDKRDNFNEQESIRESKLEMLQRKGIKAPQKSECVLWNCPRKEYQRKRPFGPRFYAARSASRLSNLSTKSRSPIIFRRSP